MTFEERYRALELKFKDRIQIDNQTLLKDYPEKSYYLPNVEPKGPVDFVLVAMEPSGTGQADGPSNVPRNFMASYEDFLMQFCLRKYLCRAGQSCHVTDVAKGGMPTAQAKETRKERWAVWYPLLEEELRLVSMRDAKIIALGRTVERFLINKKTPGLFGSIPHFSTQASLARTIAPQLLPKEYEEFSGKMDIGQIIRTAKELMQGKEFDEYRDSILKKFPQEMTESGKELMFTYHCLFTVMSGGSLSNLR